MTTPAEIAARHTDLDVEGFAHLQRLLGCWGILSDLSFSDLLLLAPVRGSTGAQLVVLGQVRPSTSATALRVDLVGEMMAVGDWPLAAQAMEEGRVVSGNGILPVEVPKSVLLEGQHVYNSGETGDVPVVPPEVTFECVPIGRSGASSAAVVVRVRPLRGSRRGGRLERVYHELYQRLVTMVAAGSYPFPGDELASEDAPRVGDGLIVVDTDGRASFASPNAMSALHRMGVTVAVEGHRLADLGIENVAVDHALATGRPVVEEVERRPDAIMLLHCTPLLEGEAVTGAMVLVRDVTDLRRLDRLLLSKDAAIREVHHRVKNNLQTISALLRLQARRLDPGAGREALREAERRVRSIAVVHEILSRDPGDQVPFREIVELLVKMAEDAVPPGVEVTIRVTGDPGEVTADVATPLAVVLAELLQNAVEHAFGARAAGSPGSVGSPGSPGHPLAGPAPARSGGNVDLVMRNDGAALSVSLCDDGKGLPEGFDIEGTSSLGLSIVRDLVTTQLYGEMRMGAAPGGRGTLVEIGIPLGEPDH
ncbi:MAG: sensor histidine kinase [Acidimicrobiales bacterium]|nr:histidine kinase N-terminal domain-containing protein [Actinomycetota bacterium]